jgi:hypothetical protein
MRDLAHDPANANHQRLGVRRTRPSVANRGIPPRFDYSTVTLFARFLGLSTSVPRITAA